VLGERQIRRAHSTQLDQSAAPEPRSCITGGSLLIRDPYPAALLPPRSRGERAQVLIRASD
jgi:hypothetical protein